LRRCRGLAIITLDASGNIHIVNAVVRWHRAIKVQGRRDRAYDLPEIGDFVDRMRTCTFALPGKMRRVDCMISSASKAGPTTDLRIVHGDGGFASRRNIAIGAIR
jgi:hypothetical protein